MVRVFDDKKSQAGSLLIEAMAMLGLIAMVTPMLYKKSAERTTELQDINAAGQIRIAMDAIDTYLADNYNTIVGLGDGSRTVTSNCSGSSSSITYNFPGGVQTVPIEHFCEYLPYGFNASSKTFKNLEVRVKKRDFGTGDRSDLTGLLVTTPAETQEMPILRASRIASMIGTNAGFVRNKKIQGVQGVWSIDNPGDFDLDASKLKENTIVATSIRAIASGSSSGENVLHRVRMEEEPWLNTMETTLYMDDNGIEDVGQMIVNGKAANDKDQAILLTDGAGLTIETGNANIGGDIDVGGSATIDGDATIGGHLEALTAEIKDWLKAGSAEITGSLTAGGGKFEVDAGGNTTINANLTVTGDTNLNNLTVTGDTKLKDLVVEGTSHLQQQVVIGKMPDDYDPYFILDVNGPARFRDEVQFDKPVDMEDLDVNNLLRAGCTQRNPDNTCAENQYNFWADPDSVSILVNNFTVGDPDGTGGFDVTDELIKMKADEVYADTPHFAVGDGTGTLVVDSESGTTPVVEVNNATFEVNDKNDSTIFEVDPEAKEVKVMNDANFIASSAAGDKIFAIDTNYTDGTKPDASIYVRKGAIEIARNTDASSDHSDSNSYIKVDRMLSNVALDMSAYQQNYRASSGKELYDEYQVNPAYTSVMHDIKLVTRGGARLSDILPDFINKGIYVLDGTYCATKNCTAGADSLNWLMKGDGQPEDSSSFPLNTSSLFGSGVIATQSFVKSCPTSTFKCETSPWLGFVPAPTCPPGYLKVATLSPISWAMAQAGHPVEKTNGANNEVELQINRDPNSLLWPESDSWATYEGYKKALTFQKSTWLNTSFVSVKDSGGTSYGWNAAIGFLYPARDYQTYANEIGLGSSWADDDVIWNLFEVWNRQIVGISNVYCYFNRRAEKGDFTNDDLVDRYDQLTKVRVGYDSKESGYVNRLNDPTLKYNDPF